MYDQLTFSEFLALFQNAKKVAHAVCKEIKHIFINNSKEEEKKNEENPEN